MPGTKTLTVTTIQAQLYWEDKQANRAMFEQKIFSIKEKTELVVLPEMFSTGFSMEPERLAETMDGETVQWMKRVAAEKKIILTGSIIIEENGEYFNRLIWMLPNGQYGFYDKRHCFGYAGEDEHYAAGTKRLIASVNGWKINLMVCYDLRFPVWARQQIQPEGPEYDVLVYVANWPERRK
ncbi:MAG: nitrilase family protein, partial [Bacteroidetes bacterium]|nr:nitrilase family protein [Bacteroidota bacterium]